MITDDRVTELVNRIHRNQQTEEPDTRLFFFSLRLISGREYGFFNRKG
jgi:hypothetical protein